MTEAESAVVIDLAKGLLELMSQTDPEWTRAFFRFAVQPGRFGSVASYVASAKVTIIDPFCSIGFFESMNAKCARLMSLLGKEAGIVLLSVGCDLSYKIDFEFADLDRWRITKLNGGTGIPDGADA